jgi:DNA-binding NarL/FixJ family response regulator
LREKGRPNDDVREYTWVLAPLKITEREAEVARFVAWHFDNAEIADALGIEVSTVKTHVEHLLQKFDVENRGILAGEVRLIIDAHRAECERKGQAAAAELRLVRRKRPSKAARPTDESVRREEA